MAARSSGTCIVLRTVHRHVLARVISLSLLIIFSVTTTEGLNILVVGGSGRVGGSTVRWLDKFSSRKEEKCLDDGNRLNLLVGCRSRESFDKAQRRRVIPSSNGAATVSFVRMDLDNDADSRVKDAIDGCDLVVHTAGPFQGRRDPKLLRCCIDKNIPYVDVCDEYELAVASKDELDAAAKSAGVAAVVASGIWPGVSALLAADAVARLEERAGAGGSCDALEFSFFTAGTGNAGPTILSATFLLLATPVLTYRDGRALEKRPWTERKEADFGPRVGVKPVWLLDNPDVPTVATSLGVPNAMSRFGTDPLFWNYLFYLIRAIPESLLKNREAMQAFALFSEPIVRVVDKLVGSTNAMRVDAKTLDGKTVVTSRMVHPDLESCVGLATAAFAVEVLKGIKGRDTATIPPGVWYPAELPKLARSNILEAAKEDTITYDLG